MRLTESACSELRQSGLFLFESKQIQVPDFRILYNSNYKFTTTTIGKRLCEDFGDFDYQDLSTDRAWRETTFSVAVMESKSVLDNIGKRIHLPSKESCFSLIIIVSP